MFTHLQRRNELVLDARQNGQSVVSQTCKTMEFELIPLRASYLPSCRASVCSWYLSVLLWEPWTCYM